MDSFNITQVDVEVETNCFPFCYREVDMNCQVVVDCSVVVDSGSSYVVVDEEVGEVFVVEITQVTRLLKLCFLSPSL